MPIMISADATCDQFGKTAPRKLDCSFWSMREMAGGQEFRSLGVAVQGLATWFYKRDGMACSSSCREKLKSTFTDRGTAEWTRCG